MTAWQRRVGAWEGAENERERQEMTNEAAAEKRHYPKGDNVFVPCRVPTCSVCAASPCPECNDLGGKPDLEGVLSGRCQVCGRRA